MKRTLAALLVLGLVACGEEAPKPVAAKPAPPPPVAQPAPPPPAPAESQMAAAPKPDPDRELALRVKRALEGAAKVDAAAIDVTATQGVVTLWGTAPTEAERRRAAGIAGKVEGVKSVANKLAIVKGS